MRLLFAPLIIPTLPKQGFPFQGAQLDYFYHRYNMTWACERCVEIPVGLFYLEQFRERRVLEVGNVLSHYFPIRHDVLDKFEKGNGIINHDIVDFTPADRYDLVLSISTFEHIGFDDEADIASDKKILAAIAACRGLLKAGGKLVITVPIGYNPYLDGLIRDERLGANAAFYFERTRSVAWQSVGKKEALLREYRRPYPYANAILIGEFRPSN